MTHFEDAPTLNWRNESASDALPFACVQLQYTGSNATALDGDEGYFNGGKVDSDGLSDAGRIAFNGAHTVKGLAGSVYSFGSIQTIEFLRVLCNYDAGSPSPGDLLVPVEDEWYLEVGTGDVSFVFVSEDSDEAYVDGDIKSVWVRPNVGTGGESASLDFGWARTPPTGIPAASDDGTDVTPGSASCGLMEFSGGVITPVSPASNVTVYSQILDIPIPGNVPIQWVQRGSQKWLVSANCASS